MARGMITRRSFCTHACQLASGTAIATLLPACGSSSGAGSSPTSPTSNPTPLAVVSGQFSGNTVRVSVGAPLSAVGGAALVESVAGVFLLARTGDTTFAALDAICTHQSCTITSQDASIFVCPCHGSRYDRSGRVVGGPAPAALRQYAATFADGVVSIAL
jgi:Rieske Fe-S protein